MELVSDNELTATAAAQLAAPRYEPATLTEPEPMVSEPENTAPVAVGQVNLVTPTGNATCGRTAKAASGAVGN